MTVEALLALIFVAFAIPFSCLIMLIGEFLRRVVRGYKTQRMYARLQRKTF